MFDSPSGELIREFNSQSVAYSVVFSPDGKLILIGGDTTVSLWDAAVDSRVIGGLSQYHAENQ
jgi:WD40 repeat protein